ncbi:EspG family protein [Amycolatopsis marina]|uniref:EspG family protein n=1 Tax=Amycolatopsis marina TaxID=490629 RepID=A0A1I1B1A4_9PSEU|nr:ESX secretion-associated protein EspG [Amycolatopsis marina]SFB43582.1 EspG family protein [Amycolatopsis marina]
MTVTFESPVEHRVQFGLPELDAIGAYAGRRPPFPLRVPSFGRIEGERDALLASAIRSLSERGLATTRGPVGIAADLVTALRQHRSTIDLVVVDGSVATGVVAVFHGPGALVCHQPIGGVPGPVTVLRVTAAALTDELVKQIPRVEAAQAIPITLPPGVVDDATRLQEGPTGAALQQRIRALVRERGGDEAAVDAVVNLLPSVPGRGQLGATVRRAGGAVERPLETSWLDSPKGRVRVDKDPSGWVSINPLRHSELLRALREAAAAARS